MNALSVSYAILFYVATLLLVAGVARKVFVYARTPQPLKIPTTPAPATKPGVWWRMLKEVTIFESLFKSNKWTWAFGWIFHAALFLILFRHVRYFTEPVWMLVTLAQPFGKYAAWGMLIGLIGLLGRRIVVDRVRYISAPSDYLMLVLLLGIAGTGAAMKFLPGLHTDIISLKAFFLGLMVFDWQALPSEPMLLIHLFLVALLMIIFPISKLLHAPGVFFSPTRNQVDDSREKRWTAGWTADGSSATSKPV